MLIDVSNSSIRRALLAATEIDRSAEVVRTVVNVIGKSQIAARGTYRRLNLV